MSTDELLITFVLLNGLILVAFLFICFRHLMLQRVTENEYYTDYTHKGLILRVYKPEFEYEAIGKVSLDKILDRGTLTQFYNWALIEK